LNLKIDSEFKDIIPPLTDEEYRQLEENVKSEGCRDAIVVWNGTIIDGHNRYKICQENGIEFKTEQIHFKDKSEAKVWMLRNQLGRRNLSDFQKNKIALEFQDTISEQMRNRQRAAGGDKKSVKAKIASVQSNHSDSDKTTLRTELAKIAGTSESSIYRSKQILEKGTPEQIERARRGGKGNSIDAISKEIKAAKEIPTVKVCKDCKKELPVSEFYYGRNKCKQCVNGDRPIRDIKGNRLTVPPEIRALTEEQIVGNLYAIDTVIVHTIDDCIMEFTCNFQTFLGALDSILQKYRELLKDNENNKKIMATLSESVEAMKKMKETYSYEKL